MCVLEYKQWEEVLAVGQQEVISVLSASSSCAIRCQPQSPFLCYSRKPDVPVPVKIRGCVYASPGRAPGAGEGQPWVPVPKERSRCKLTLTRATVCQILSGLCLDLWLLSECSALFVATQVQTQEVPSASGEVDFGVCCLF